MEELVNALKDIGKSLKVLSKISNQLEVLDDINNQLKELFDVIAYGNGQLGEIDNSFVALLEALRGDDRSDESINERLRDIYYSLGGISRCLSDIAE